MTHRLLTLLSLSSFVVAQGCFYPNGSPANGDILCQDGNVSSCCGPNSICLTNGLCLSVEQPFTLSRGSCTDSTWQSPQCPNVCKDSRFLLYQTLWQLLIAMCCDQFRRVADARSSSIATLEAPVNIAATLLASIQDILCRYATLATRS